MSPAVKRFLAIEWLVLVAIALLSFGMLAGTPPDSDLTPEGNFIYLYPTYLFIRVTAWAVKVCCFTRSRA